MSVVGRAYVTVRAITAQLGRDIQSGVDGALHDVDIGLSSDVGTKIGDSLGEGLESSKVSDKIGDQIRNSEPRATHYSHDIGQKVGNALGDAIGAELIRTSPVSRALARAVIPDRDSVGLGERIGQKVMVGVGSGLLKVGMQPMVWIGALALPAITDALAVAVSLSGTLISTIAATGPAFVAAGAVGAGGLGVLLTTIGTITGALKANTRELAVFKESLTPVQDEFRGIGLAIQREFLPNLSEAATRATFALGPTLRTELAGTGDALGDVALQAARLTEQPAFQEHFAGMLRSNTSALRDFGAAGVLSLSAAVQFGDAAGPLLNRFSDWTRELAKGADESIRAADETGRLDAFLEKSGDTAAQLGDIFGDTFGGLFDILQQATPAGETLLDRIQQNAAEFREWTESAAGSNSIKAFFDNSIPVAHEFGRLLGSIIDEFTDRGINEGGLVDSMRTLRTDVVPALGDVLAIATTVSRELLGAVAPAVGTLAEELLPTVRDVAHEVAHDLGPALQRVAPDLGELASAALDLVGALTPALGPASRLASILINAVTPGVRGVATVLDALPDSVQGVVVSLVALRLGFGAFMRSARFEGLRQSVTASMSAVRAEMSRTATAGGRFRVGLSGAVGMLGGPWGIALAAGATAIGYFAQKHAEASADVDELTSTLNTQTGAVTQNTREWAAKKLEEEGALRGAQDLGLNLETVTDAALGQAGALRAVTRELRGVVEAQTVTTSEGPMLTQTGQKAQDLLDVLESTNGTLDTARGSWKRTSAAIGETGRAQDKYKGSTDETKGSLEGAERAQRGLTSAVLAYQDATVKAIQGNIGLEQSIDDAAKEMREGKRTLNIHTQAGRDNMTALLGIAEAANNVTGSAEKQQRAMERARNKIIQYADGMGMTRKEAIALADRIIALDRRYEGLPPKKETKIEAETREANQNLDTVTHKLNDIDGRRANAGINVDSDRAEAALDNVANKLHTLDGLTVTPIIGPIVSGLQGAVDQARGGRAGGGWVWGPGTSTSDSIAYGSHNVSNLEFVVRADAASANAKLLETVNRTGRPPASDGRPPIHLTVNNPVAERTSTTLQDTLVRLAQLGLLETP